MMLVEDGKLRLDDPVAKYIPAFAKAKVGVDVQRRRRTRHIRPRAVAAADHHRRFAQAHIGHHLRLLWRDPACEASMRSPELSAGDCDNGTSPTGSRILPLADQPGTRWNYGHSTDMLGRVIEVASGQSLYHFVKQRLFGPFGMCDTSYQVAVKRVAACRGAVSGRSWSGGRDGRDPTVPGNGRPAAPVWLRRFRTMRTSCKCC